MNIIFNSNFQRDLQSLRELEIRNFKGLIAQDDMAMYPINQGDAPSSYTLDKGLKLFLVRKRYIKFLDLWNRFLNSGLFKFDAAVTSGGYTFGANISHGPTEAFRRLGGYWSQNSTFYIDNIKMLRVIQDVIAGYVKQWNNIENTTVTTLSAGFMEWDVQDYAEYNSLGATSLRGLLNSSFDIYNPELKTLMNEFRTLLFSVLDESKLTSIYSKTFNDFSLDTLETAMNFANGIGLYNCIKDSITLVDENVKPTNSTLLYQLKPQFGCQILTQGMAEDIQLLNTAIDTSAFTNTDYLTTNNFVKPRYIYCSALKTSRPLALEFAQFINWNDPDDHPYIMSYNGCSIAYIPDEIKNNELQPDYQWNISANFWKIGTVDQTDPNYNVNDDVKLKLDKELYSTSKIDFLDNLTLYLKLD